MSLGNAQPFGAFATAKVELAMDQPVKVDKQDARQGKTGLNVRYVLVIGLILVIAALAAVAMLTR